MLTTLIRRTLLFTLPLVVLVAAWPAGAAGSTAIRFMRNGQDDFNVFSCGWNGTPCSTASEQAWMHQHYWRMRGYTPWFDIKFGSASAINWAPATHLYEDLYGISRKTDSTGPNVNLLAKHPDWVLRAGPDNPRTKKIEGAKLYIPFMCDDPEPGCPAFAANPARRGWRDYWIARVKAIVARGYAGLYIDNVNMDWRISNGSGQYVKPWDPRTGKQMTLVNWRRYVARFTELIRKALPGYEIIHNGFYWQNRNNPEVQREIAVSDYLDMERGFDDAGLTGGPSTDKYAYQRLLAFIDWLHARGKSIILEPHFNRSTMAGQTPTVAVKSARREHEIAGYLLARELRDSLASDFQSDPPRGLANDWSPIWETDLGAPIGGRFGWTPASTPPCPTCGSGVLRRNFANGFVLVNLPEQPQRTIDLGGTYRRLDGSLVTQVTLRRTPLPWQSPPLTLAEEEVSQGAVLLNP